MSPISGLKGISINLHFASSASLLGIHGPYTARSQRTAVWVTGGQTSHVACIVLQEPQGGSDSNAHE